MGNTPPSTPRGEIAGTVAAPGSSSIYVDNRSGPSPFQGVVDYPRASRGGFGPPPLNYDNDVRDGFLPQQDPVYGYGYQQPAQQQPYGYGGIAAQQDARPSSSPSLQMEVDAGYGYGLYNYSDPAYATPAVPPGGGPAQRMGFSGIVPPSTTSASLSGNGGGYAYGYNPGGGYNSVASSSPAHHLYQTPMSVAGSEQRLSSIGGASGAGAISGQSIVPQANSHYNLNFITQPSPGPKKKAPAFRGEGSTIDGGEVVTENLHHDILASPDPGTFRSRIFSEGIEFTPKKGSAAASAATAGRIQQAQRTADGAADMNRDQSQLSLRSGGILSGAGSSSTNVPASHQSILFSSTSTSGEQLDRLGAPPVVSNNPREPPRSMQSLHNDLSGPRVRGPAATGVEYAYGGHHSGSLAGLQQQQHDYNLVTGARIPHTTAGHLLVPPSAPASATATRAHLRPGGTAHQAESEQDAAFYRAQFVKLRKKTRQNEDKLAILKTRVAEIAENAKIEPDDYLAMRQSAADANLALIQEYDEKIRVWNAKIHETTLDLIDEKSKRLKQKKFLLKQLAVSEKSLEAMEAAAAAEEQATGAPREIDTLREMLEKRNTEFAELQDHAEQEIGALLEEYQQLGGDEENGESGNQAVEAPIIQQDGQDQEVPPAVPPPPQQNQLQASGDTKMSTADAAIIENYAQGNIDYDGVLLAGVPQGQIQIEGISLASPELGGGAAHEVAGAVASGGATTAYRAVAAEVRAASRISLPMS
mmetsp:Transcript_27832/g.70338  ORF Transcript_27832/g.70338 Transcript_27832/m.70338 type:complete len:757 (-) Transcript_27832:297-2567(-)